MPYNNYFRFELDINTPNVIKTNGIITEKDGISLNKINDQNIAQATMT